MQTIGERIKQKRKELKMNLSDVKSKSTVSIGNLSEIENNKYMPSAQTIIELSRLFNVTTDWLLLGVTNESSAPVVSDPLLDKINKLNKYDREDIEVMVDTKLKRYGEGLSSNSMITDKYDKIG